MQTYLCPLTYFWIHGYNINAVFLHLIILVSKTNKIPEMLLGQAVHVIQKNHVWITILLDSYGR